MQYSRTYTAFIAKILGPAFCSLVASNTTNALPTLLSHLPVVWNKNLSIDFYLQAGEVQEVYLPQ